MAAFKTHKTETVLAKGLILRPVLWTDLEPVAQVIYDVCQADGDTSVAVTPAELRNEWQNEGFRPETDAFVVQTLDGRVVGYGEFTNVQGHYSLRADGYVHPEFKGRGIGRALLRAIEARAREEMEMAETGLRVFIRNTIENKDRAGHELHQQEDYFPKRYHWRMEIKLKAAPPLPAWPEGIALRPFIRGRHSRLVWEVQNEAFRDHWGSHDIPFQEWEHGKFNRPDFDPSLWMIAWDGEEIAGFSLNRMRMGIGWVGSLGVRRQWRRQGLGLALLQHSFGEFFRRGETTIGLGVDASNPTGATRLYQRAGMVVASEFLTYEKELRPGRQLEE